MKRLTYRIVQEGDKFYPEERVFLIFWSRFNAFVDNIDIEEDEYFHTLEDAKEFICGLSKTERKSVKIIHKVDI